MWLCRKQTKGVHMKWFSTKEVSVLMDSTFFFQSIVKVCPLENSLDMMLLEVRKNPFSVVASF